MANYSSLVTLQGRSEQREEIRFGMRTQVPGLMSTATQTKKKKPTSNETTKEQKKPCNVLDISHFLIRKLLTGRSQHIFVVACDLHLIIHIYGEIQHSHWLLVMVIDLL